MKTLSRMVSACAVLAATSMSLAADCRCQNGQMVVRPNGGTTVAVTPQRYAYRSGYNAVATPIAPMSSYSHGYGVYSSTRPLNGPESQWAFMRARQHVRGW